MARILPHITASSSHEGPRGREEMRSQITALLLAVLIPELPVKSSLITGAGPHGVSLRLRWGEKELLLLSSPKVGSHLKPETKCLVLRHTERLRPSHARWNILEVKYCHFDWSYRPILLQYGRGLYKGENTKKRESLEATLDTGYNRWSVGHWGDNTPLLEP